MTVDNDSPDPTRWSVAKLRREWGAIPEATRAAMITELRDVVRPAVEGFTGTMQAAYPDYTTTDDVDAAVAILAHRLNVTPDEVLDTPMPVAAKWIRGLESIGAVGSTPPASGPWTQHDLTDAADISNDTFGKIRKAAGLPGNRRGGGAARRTYDRADLRRLIAAIPKAGVTKSGEKARTGWTELLEKNEP